MTSVHQRMQSAELKGNSWNGRKYLQIIYLNNIQNVQRTFTTQQLQNQQVTSQNTQLKMDKGLE